MLNVGVTMRFSPSEVAKAVHQCWEEVPSALEAGNATVCFTIQKSSLDQLGESLPMGHSPLLPERTPPLSSGESGPRNADATSTSMQLLALGTWVPSLPRSPYPVQSLYL